MLAPSRSEPTRDEIQEAGGSSGEGLRVLFPTWPKSQHTRFLRHAEALASLQHPGIQGLADFGIDDQGCPFLVPAPLEATSLREELGRDAFHLGFKVQRWALGLAEALEALHGVGLSHGNLRPEAVRLRGGSPVLPLESFWWQAPAVPELPSEAFEDRVEGPLEDAPSGTAPERLLGETPNRSADIWGLANLVYESLYGHPWNRWRTAPEAQEELLQPPVPLAKEARLGRFPILDPVLWRALSHQPNRRLGSLGALTEALLAEDFHDDVAAEAGAGPGALQEAGSSERRNAKTFAWSLIRRRRQGDVGILATFACIFLVPFFLIPLQTKPIEDNGPSWRRAGEWRDRVIQWRVRLKGGFDGVVSPNPKYDDYSDDLLLFDNWLAFQHHGKAEREFEAHSTHLRELALATQAPLGHPGPPGLHRPVEDEAVSDLVDVVLRDNGGLQWETYLRAVGTAEVAMISLDQARPPGWKTAVVEWLRRAVARMERLDTAELSPEDEERWATRRADYVRDANLALSWIAPGTFASASEAFLVHSLTLAHFGRSLPESLLTQETLSRLGSSTSPDLHELAEAFDAALRCNRRQLFAAGPRIDDQLLEVAEALERRLGSATPPTLETLTALLRATSGILSVRSFAATRDALSTFDSLLRSYRALGGTDAGLETVATELGRKAWKGGEAGSDVLERLAKISGAAPPPAPEAAAPIEAGAGTAEAVAPPEEPSQEAAATAPTEAPEAPEVDEAPDARQPPEPEPEPTPAPPAPQPSRTAPASRARVTPPEPTGPPDDLLPLPGPGGSGSSEAPPKAASTRIQRVLERIRSAREKAVPVATAASSATPASPDAAEADGGASPNQAIWDSFRKAVRERSSRPSASSP